MKIEKMIELLPLVRDNVTQYRKEINIMFAKSYLSTLHVGEELEFDELRMGIINHLGLEDFPKFLFSQVAEELVNQMYLEKKDDNTYIIIQEVAIPDFDEYIKECFDESLLFIKEKNKDYEPFLNANYFDAFREIIYEIGYIFLESQKDQFGEFDLTLEPEIKQKLVEKCRTIGVDKPDQLVEAILSYLLSGSKKITDLLFRIYNGAAVSMDILQKGKELCEASKDIGAETCIYLDTNTLINLLCKNLPNFELADSTIKLSNKLKFNIYYTEKTSNELDILIRASNRLMMGRTGSENEIIQRENQIIKNFMMSRETSWSDYYAEISNYEKILEMVYNVKKVENPDFERDEELFEYLGEIYPIVIDIHRKKRSPEALDHDKWLINMIKHFRDTTKPQVFDCPWIVTMDKVLIHVNEFVCSHFDIDFGYAIHLRTWLNTLLRYRSIIFSDENKSKLVHALLKYMVVPKEEYLTLRSWAKLITYRLGLREDDIENVYSLFTKSPLHSELVRALNNRNTDDIINTTNRILTDTGLIEKLFEASKFKQIIAKKEEQIKQVSQKYKEEKAQREAYEKVATAPSVVQNFIEGVDPKISQLFEILLCQIEEANPYFFEESGLRKPSKENISKEETKTLLITIKEKISSGVDFAVKLSHLMPLIDRVLKYL